MGLRQRHPLLMQTTRFVEDRGGLPEQDGMASEPEDKSGPAPRRDDVDHLRSSAMPVSADPGPFSFPI